MAYWKTITSAAKLAGTSLQGVVNTSYEKIVDRFGEPGFWGPKGGSRDVEWAIEFPDGTIATIYNWKSGPAYLGPEGTPIKDITRWNVGGDSKKSALWVEAALTGSNKKDIVKLMFRK